MNGNITRGTGYSRLTWWAGSLLVGGGNGSIDVSELEFYNTYSLSGTGSLKADKSLVCADGFSQDGGTNTVTGDVIIGKAFLAGQPRTYGSYTLNGGTLTAATCRSSTAASISRRAP